MNATARKPKIPPEIHIDEARVELAKKAFLGVGSSLTVRAGAVAGKVNFDARMRAAIAKYLETEWLDVRAEGGDA